MLYEFTSINPLNPKSDQPQISPYDINALENRVVMRMDHFTVILTFE